MADIKKVGADSDCHDDCEGGGERGKRPAIVVDVWPQPSADDVATVQAMATAAKAAELAAHLAVFEKPGQETIDAWEAAQAALADANDALALIQAQADAPIALVLDVTFPEDQLLADSILRDSYLPSADKIVQVSVRQTIGGFVSRQSRSSAAQETPPESGSWTSP